MAISKVKLPNNTVEPIKDNVTPRMYIGTCPTAAATVTKVVTVEDFPLDSEGEPLIGTLIGVKFSNTNSATAPKLDVNEIGAKSIYYNSAEASSTSSVYGGSASRYAYYVWDGTYWVWVTHGTDNNDNTLAYNVRYNSASKTTIDKFVRYRILFTSADDAHWVPANTSTSTNATASRTVNQTPINPFGQIVYYGSTTAISADGTPGASVLYTQYALTFGYSFNRTGAALTLTTKAPVYIKCAPQSNGSAIIDADTPYVQALPSTEDGKIYIYLGVASSATAVEMSIVHPVYYYKDGLIRPWTNAVAGVTDAVRYTAQTLTDSQKAQARTNIGASEEMEAISTDEIYEIWGVVHTIKFWLDFADDPQQAEYGMTWSEFVASEYNTHGLIVSNNYITTSDGGAYLLYGSNYVRPTDEIIEDTWDGEGIHIMQYGWEF